jgi:uncharacterized protein
MDGIHGSLIRNLISVILVLSVYGQAQEIPQMKVKYIVKPKVQSFDLRDVQLLESPFKHAMEKDRDYLLILKPDRLLSRCREYAGLTPKDSAYGGWERETISSHFLGHYLSACALQYRASGDKRFLDRVNYVVDELSECQKANGNGYVAGIPNGKKVFAEVAAGDIRTKGFDLNGLWVPWYVIHKIMAGLREAYLLCDNQKAKEVMVGLADFAYETTKNLSEEQFQKMLDCEHGGMNEVLADVYAFTGDQKYLELAKKFYHHAVMDPLARREDKLRGRHGNTNIPKLIGAARIYELTGEENFGTSSEFFWETVVHNHTYVCGGHGEGEYFGEPGKLNDRLTENTMETCNTYNMLKLTRFLFMREPRAEYADFYERALYNHILASQNPDDGMVCYFVPLASGTYKQFSTQFDDFTCCLGTGTENHSKYGESIYFHSDNELYVNLFIPSELSWHDKYLKLRQITDFPESGKTLLQISCEKPIKLALKIRRPFWAGEGFQIKVNDKVIDVKNPPQNYITVEQEWHNGDIVEILLPLKLRSESMPDNPKRVAVMYGPIVMAGNLGAIESEPDVPVMVTNSQLVNAWVKSVAGKELTFVTNNVGRPTDVTLIPFYQMYNRRHGVYWDLYTEEEFKEREKNIIAEKARKKEMESRTIDIMRIGEMQPERDHNLQGEKTEAGQTMDYHWRIATEGGWFSFEMKSLPDQPLELCATYWGSENRNREFEIYINGEKIASQLLENNKPGEYFDQIYPIPETITKGKEKIIVKYQALPAKHAGRLFGCRILKRQ